MAQENMFTCITVNYNSAAATIGLLRSLERQTDGSFDVIVVDNDSSADDRAMLAAYAATSPLALEVIHSGVNRGFSGGNNIGIRKALAQGTQWAFLINPDTTVAPDFISTLRLRLPREPALVGTPVREGARIAYAGAVRWLSSTLSHAYSPRRDGYVIGAAMAIHRDVFARVGALDERYFLYFEDAEYSLRARRAGIPVVFVPSPVVSHAVQGTTSALGAPKLLRYHMRNALLMNATHGPWWVRAALPWWAAVILMKQLLKYPVIPGHRTRALAIVAGIADHYRRHYGRIA